MPAVDLARARATFTSEADILRPENEVTYNLYTIHKQGVPRFRHLPEPSFRVILFPDDCLGLAPLKKHILRAKRHEDGAEYSHEISDIIPSSKVSETPIPLLGPFFSGQCARYYLETKDIIFAMAAEQLVDGMDLDEEWCKQHMSTSTPETLSFALTLVAGKASRIDYFSSNTVTCFIPDEQERQRLLRVRVAMTLPDK
jgi:hypothetical protein